MSMPDFQVLLLPVLQFASDGKEHWYLEVVEHLASQFHLTDAERQELLPSGRQHRFDNRAQWAIWYLRRAGLLETTRRGFFKISPRGQQVLTQNPPRLDVRFLKQYPEYEWHRKEKNTSSSAPPSVNSPPVENLTHTPDELMTEHMLSFDRILLRNCLCWSERHPQPSSSGLWWSCS
jgi:restriction system protein